MYCDRSGIILLVFHQSQYCSGRQFEIITCSYKCLEMFEFLCLVDLTTNLTTEAGQSNSTHVKMRVTFNARIVPICRHAASDNVKKNLMLQFCAHASLCM
jgi:hypothetical protein